MDGRQDVLVDVVGSVEAQRGVSAGVPQQVVWTAHQLDQRQSRRSVDDHVRYSVADQRLGTTISTHRPPTQYTANS